MVEIFGKGNAPSADPLAFSEELSNIMQEYWGAFAWGGVPYSGTAVATGALTWPVYRTKKADTSGSAQSEPNIWHRSKSEHQINEKHLNGSATLPVLWDSSFEGYMRLGREVRCIPATSTVRHTWCKCEVFREFRCAMHSART
eukprot:SAG31_NODE_2522_length_5565_cov_5.101903_4_plen_143_part_00